MSADVSAIHPRLRDLIAQFPAGWEVVSGTRSFAEGLAIAAWGRTVQNPYADDGSEFGPVATNALDPATSPHTTRDDGYSYAIDVRPGGTTLADYAALRAFVEARGFVSGASFNVGGTPDYAHVEVPGWRSVPCTKAKQLASAAGGLAVMLFIGGGLWLLSTKL